MGGCSWVNTTGTSVSVAKTNLGFHLPGLRWKQGTTRGRPGLMGQKNITLEVHCMEVVGAERTLPRVHLVTVARTNLYARNQWYKPLFGEPNVEAGKTSSHPDQRTHNSGGLSACKFSVPNPQSRQTLQGILRLTQTQLIRP